MNLPVRRDREHAVLAGVCAGLARRWGVDANLLRIAVAILSFSSGLGVIAYCVALALIPREGSDVAPVRRALPFTRSWSGPALGAAIVVTAVLAFALLGGWSGIGLVPVLVIAAVWFFGFSRHRRHPAGPAGQAEPTPYERAALAWQERLVQHRSLAGGAAPVPAVARPAVPGGVVSSRAVMAPAPARRRSGWWPALLLAAAGCSAVAVTGGPWLAFPAAALLALGAVLLASLRRGRPAGMAAVTVALLIVVGSGVALHGHGPAPWLEARVADALPRSSTTVLTPADVQGTVELEVGQHEFDASGLVLDGANATTAISLDAGTLQLVLPAGVNTRVDWKVDVGEVQSPDRTSDGLDLTGSYTNSPDPDGPVLHITASVDVGRLEVVQR